MIEDVGRTLILFIITNYAISGKVHFSVQQNLAKKTTCFAVINLTRKF